jgi:hypothetical protein
MLAYFMTIKQKLLSDLLFSIYVGALNNLSASNEKGPEGFLNGISLNPH